MKKAVVTLIPLLLAAATAPAESFYNISAVSSSTAATDLWPASNLIQGPGVGFDAGVPHNRLIGGAAGTWVTGAPGGFPADYIAVAGAPVITLDLGVNQALSEISVWGYTASNANGVSDFGLRFATDSEGTAGFGSSISFNPVFTALNADVARQSFSFGQTVSARYVEFTALDNYFVAPGDGSGGELAGGDRVGLGEIAFAVPEPSTLGLLALAGMAGVGLARRRR